MAQAPPPPAHILRCHTASLAALAFSDDNERLYSADASGQIVVTSTRSLRPITSWKAHTDGLLGVEEWDDYIITHGRDNKLHVWTRLIELPAAQRIGGAANQPDLPVPTLCYSMDVNALNYCRFSLMKVRTYEGNAKALVALPNLVDSDSADVWSLPSCQRIHAAIGQDPNRSIFSAKPTRRSTTGIIMSLHLFSVPREVEQPCSSAQASAELRLLCAYENGSVILRRYATQEKETSVQGKGWEVIWTVKLHAESIMAMRVSRANNLALTVSVDHLIGRYDLTSTLPPEEACTVQRTKHPGNASIAIRDDGRICAVGGWDGNIRLYSTRTFKPLGTLKYHRASCQALEFARSSGDFAPSDSKPEEGEDSDEEMSEKERIDRSRWLVGGGKDHRITIWSLMSFEKT